jgi:hypothetical protein
MFPLGYVRAWDITERWVGVYDAGINQLLQRNQMFLKARVFNPSATESQG